MLAVRCRARAGRHHRLDHRRRPRPAEAGRTRRERRGGARPVGDPLRGDEPRGRALLAARHARRRPVHGHRDPRRLQGRQRQGRGREPRHGERPPADPGPGRHDRGSHGHRRVLRGLLLDAHRRGHGREPRDPPDPAHDQRPDQRLRAPEPAVLGRPVRRRVHRPGQPPEQHHGRRVVLQQLVRPRRPARRPHRCDPDLDGRHRGDPDQRRPLRRPAGPLRRRRRQHRHAQWDEPVPRLGLLLVAQRRPGRHRGEGQQVQPRHVRLQALRGLAVGSDHQGQAVLLRQLRERQVHPARDDLPGERGRRDGGRQRDARPRLRPRPAELVPEVELRLRHRRLPGLPVRDAGQALPRQARLQPERPQQDQPPLPPARLADAGAAVELELARLRQPPHQHERPQLRELELRDPREHQVGRRRVELDHQLEQGQPADGRLHHERREPPAVRQALPVRRHPEGGVRLHLVRLRAVHAEQRAALPHVPGAGQLHVEPRQPQLHVRRDRRALPLRQRLLPRLPERLRLQLARRLLHGRERLPRQPEPDGVAGEPLASSRSAGTTSRARRSRCSRSTCGTAASTPRTSGGRPAT